MRRVLAEQTYLNVNQETSLKVVRDYRAKYDWIDECLDANPTILWLVHEDLEGLSKSKEGREALHAKEQFVKEMTKQCSVSRSCWQQPC